MTPLGFGPARFFADEVRHRRAASITRRWGPNEPHQQRNTTANHDLAAAVNLSTTRGAG
jgi:hypothetical protein